MVAASSELTSLSQAIGESKHVTTRPADGWASSFWIGHGDSPSTTLCLSNPDETINLIEFRPEDQIVWVGAGARLDALNRVLKESGLCIPVYENDPTMPWSAGSASLSTHIALNLPHALEGQYGNWRDWVLGMTVILADGRVVKCGSAAVKNVAGYDLHRLMIGARGTLAYVAEVILRLTPVQGMKSARLERLKSDEEVRIQFERFHTESWWVQRVLPSDWNEAQAAATTAIVALDSATCTLFAAVQPEDQLPRYGGDWLIRSGCGKKNLNFTGPTTIRFMRRTKQLFDPTSKFNSGEMGIF